MFASSSGGPTGAGWRLFGVWSESSETLAYPVSPEEKAVPHAASTCGLKSAKEIKRTTYWHDYSLLKKSKK